jgi:hypothetical protein
MAKYQVLSPDGITIDFNKWTYPSMKKAEEAFENWKKRYEQQGYYSSNFNRIPLNELKHHCTFKKLN